MRVIDWSRFLENGLPIERKLSSMTVGLFDGMHRGHQALIERVVSGNLNGTPLSLVPVVVTFAKNHKLTRGQNKERAADIQSFQERLETLEKLGVQITIAIDFTESFRKITGNEFLNALFKNGNIGFFAVGSGFRCGFRLDTDAAAIQKFFAARGVSVEIVPEVMEGSLPISSSRIRQALASGDIALAETMLGYKPGSFQKLARRGR